MNDDGRGQKRARRELTAKVCLILQRISIFMLPGWTGLALQSVTSSSGSRTLGAIGWLADPWERCGGDLRMNIVAKEILVWSCREKSALDPFVEQRMMWKLNISNFATVVVRSPPLIGRERKRGDAWGINKRIRIRATYFTKQWFCIWFDLRWKECERRFSSSLVVFVPSICG